MTKKETLIEEFIPIMKDFSPYTHVLDIRPGNKDENCDVVVTHWWDNLPGWKHREETQKIDVVDCDTVLVADKYYYVLRLRDENGELLNFLRTDAEFIAWKLDNEEYLLWNKKDIKGLSPRYTKEVYIKLPSNVANEAKSICSHTTD